MLPFIPFLNIKSFLCFMLSMVLCHVTLIAGPKPIEKKFHSSSSTERLLDRRRGDDEASASNSHNLFQFNFSISCNTDDAMNSASLGSSTPLIGTSTDSTSSCTPRSQNGITISSAPLSFKERETARDQLLARYQEQFQQYQSNRDSKPTVITSPSSSHSDAATQLGYQNHEAILNQSSYSDQTITLDDQAYPKKGTFTFGNELKRQLQASH